MSATEILGQLVGALASGRIRVIDLTQTLTPEFPQIALPPEMGQCWPFRIEEVSKYDERGPGWYWNNFSCSEHTGTHFDAPIHWISGRDLPNNSVDTIPAQHFVAPACVIDCSAQSAADPDYLMTVADSDIASRRRRATGAACSSSTWTRSASGSVSSGRAGIPIRTFSLSPLALCLDYAYIPRAFVTLPTRAIATM